MCFLEGLTCSNKMGRTKIDNRIKTFIENGVKLQHRSMFVIVGDKGKDQVMILHHILSKTVVKARPSVLWCYKKELGFSSNRKRRMKQVQRNIKAGKVNINEEDPFELFIASTNIRYCYYAETQKILGQTFGVCVLQDFEAITPNLLARTIETVEGGGLVIILLRTMNSLKQFYSMAMDVHDRYRTEAHKDVVGRFNERFILSLSSCERCLVVDSSLNVLPISSHVLNVEAVSVEETKSESDIELKELVNNLRDTQPIGSIIACCKTLDQAKAVLKFVDAISEKTLRYTTSLTAARGRGKSAALGLAVSAAVAFGYTNIFVTSPSPDNLKTFFEFVFKGFDSLGYQEHLDYGLVESTNAEYNKALIRVNIFKTNRQTIQYIHPTDANKLSHAELLVIDEAAAIPLPYVKRMLGPYLVFLSSTINGYEGTGRSLSLKLIHELRAQSADTGISNLTKSTKRTLYEITLEESIRYRSGDDVEEWLTNILCLNANVQPAIGGIPSPSECDLYYVNRDTLFCYHKASEIFLQKMVALYVSSHYKNSPNDLQLLSDAPAHHIFCLLGPVNKNKKSLPDILCVIQVCLEGQLTSGHVSDAFSHGRKPTGDLIPWTIGQQFLDKNFPSLSGVRIVRIATHPDYQSMGYGSRALSLLVDYYSLDVGTLNDANESEDIQPTKFDREDLLSETIDPRSNLPPLLMKLSERTPERVHYIGVSYGLTGGLLRFWKRSRFVPVYVRQTPNELTGEHSCIMIRTLSSEEGSWLQEYWTDFRKRFSALLSYQFKELPTTVALSALSNKNIEKPPGQITNEFLGAHLTKYDLKRLDMYCNNLVDYHLIMDLLPTIAKLYFSDMFIDLKCTAIQSAIILGMGLQHKTVDDVAKELELPASQLMGIFNRSMRKIQQSLALVTENAVEESLGLKNLSESTLDNSIGNKVMKDLQKEMDDDSKILKRKQKKEFDSLKKEYLGEYAIKGTEEEWSKVSLGTGNTVSIIKSMQVMNTDNNELVEEDNRTIPLKKKKKKMSKKF